MNHAPFAETEHSDERMRVALQVPPALNYALVHNRVPIVQRLGMHNLTDGELRDLDVTMELVGPGGRIAGPWQRHVTSVTAGGVIEWGAFPDFVPDVAVLAATDEAFPVEYRVEVRSGGAETVRLRASCEVLAHNEWYNSPSLYDSIAAFVRPNTASVKRILRRAGTVLEQNTESSGLEGYQSGSERAGLIAGAIYEALRAESITYVGMPASFEETGQKVRTSADVLEERLGNCIDLSVTYAACLEAAGLHSLIFLTGDHAFAGFFQQERNLPETVSLETNHIVNLVDSGSVVPVELTRIGPGSDSMSFTRAVTAAIGHVHTPQRDLRGVIDVHLAHRSGIRPLHSDDRSVEETEGQEASGRDNAVGPSITLPDEVVTAGTAVDTNDGEHDLFPGAPQRIKQWGRRLLDLSLRNPLLKLPSRGKGVDLHVPEGALAALDDFVHRHTPISILPQDRISGVDRTAGIRRAQDLDDAMLTGRLTTEHVVYGNLVEQHYAKRLRDLRREARRVWQETGSNYLYLTLGALVHRDRTSEAHAPLFLMPVRLDGGTGNKPYTLVADGDEIAAPNYCLIEWLRVHHGLHIPELADPPTDDFGIDIPAALAGISRKLVEAQLHHYRVESTASLRLLQFSTSQMHHDLTDNWRRMMDNSVVRHLVEHPGAPFQDPQATGDVEVDELELRLPIPADGSQMKAITMAGQGRSFVLEGPPGTGKSQTISNLIAHAIASGRKVLFVAEKQAALDVVKQRLTRIGFDHFCLDLHGRKQSLTAIKRQLNEALGHGDNSDPHTFKAAETEFRKYLEVLRQHPNDVHERNAAGYSVWSSYDAVLAHGAGPTADIPRSFLRLSEDQRCTVEDTARELPTVLGSARVRPDHPWRISGLRTVGEADTETFRAAVVELEKARATLYRLPEQLRSAVGELPGPGALASTLKAAHLAANGYPTDAGSTELTLRPGWDAEFDAAYRQLRQFHGDHQHVLRMVSPELFEHPDLDTWHAEAETAQAALLRKKKKLREVIERIRPHIAAADEVTEDTVTGWLSAAKVARTAAGELLQRVSALGGLRLAQTWRPTHPNAVPELEAACERARVWRDVCTRHPELARLYAGLAGTLPVVALVAIAESWRHWLGVLATSEVEFTRWTRQQSWTAAWDRDGALWNEQLHDAGLRPLQRWGAVLQRFDTLEQAGLSTFSRQLLDGDVPAEDADAAFQRGLAATALDERRSHADLHYFDGAQHTHSVSRYLDAEHKLRRRVPERLAGDVLRHRPPMNTDRSSSDSELVRLLDSGSRNSLSFRQLLARYPAEVTGLTPCFLMSPTSVATFLEPESVQFDLVVFDEASQIRVAEALGAMGRARSVVVAGDPQQMPPTNVMQARHGDDEAEDENDAEPSELVEDMESILDECVASGLPKVRLTWHYRSSDETLISFSNAYYYEEQLASLPSPGSGPHDGVLARRVQGVWSGRTNRAEAEEIVTEIARMLTDPVTRRRSIGVVTFNVHQRDLLLDLLDDSTDPGIQEALTREDGEALFVKNLENVQGDERDIILFSLAFSVNPEDGKLPLNFGPLNRAGGQRRLNVAITRARRQVMLFSSFDPDDLKRANSEGLRHLRAYLEMAFNGIERVGELGSRRQRHDDQVFTEIATVLRERGYEVATRYGLSHFTVDLAVRTPGDSRWRVAILLDSPEWAQRPTVADRDAAPQLLEKLMGWPAVVRLWLPAWIGDRAAVLEEIDDAITSTAGQQQSTVESGSELAAPGLADDMAPSLTAHQQGSLPEEQEFFETGTPTHEPEPIPDAEKHGDNLLDQEPSTLPVAEVVGESEGLNETDVRAAPEPVRTAITTPVTDSPSTGVWPSEMLASASSVTDHPQQQGNDRDSEARSVTGFRGERTPDPELFVPYEPTVIGNQQDLDDIGGDREIQKMVRDSFAAAVDTEGPVEQTRLAKLVLTRFEFARKATPRVEAVLRYLPAELTVRTSDLGTFVWPVKLDPRTWHGFRKTQYVDGERSLDEVAPEEIVNAMSYVLDHQRIASQEQLYTATRKVLGLGRLSESRRDILQRAERFGEQTERLGAAKYDRRTDVEWSE